jgi:hypothetical protein
MLTRMMFTPELLEEPDIPWEMDILLSQIASDVQMGKDQLESSPEDSPMGKTKLTAKEHD